MMMIINGKEKVLLHCIKLFCNLCCFCGILDYLSLEVKLPSWRNSLYLKYICRTLCFISFSLLITPAVYKGSGVKIYIYIFKVQYFPLKCSRVEV